MSASASRTDSSRGELFKAAIPRLRDRSPKIGHICLRFPRTKRLAPKALSQTSPPQDGFAVANLGHPRKPSGLKARFTSALNSMQEYHELFRRLSFCPKPVVARRKRPAPGRTRSRLKMSRALGANHVHVK